MLIRKDLKNRLVRLKGNVLQNFNRLRSVESIFSSIYRNRRWGNEESVSGTGSRIHETRTIAEFLPAIIQRYSIRSLLDVPCGDFNWMKQVDLSAVEYYGADIVDALIRKNIKLYAAQRFNFFRADMIQDQLPRVDLIFSRDCLVHFSYHHIFETLDRIKESKSGFFLTTTFVEHSNVDIVTGSWRPINLQREPFCFPPPIELVNEGYHSSASGVADKSLALWRISDLP